jgi:hypothetical protein
MHRGQLPAAAHHGVTGQLAATEVMSSVVIIGAEAGLQASVVAAPLAVWSTEMRKVNKWLEFFES